jgi:hypothetical protein
MAVWLIILVFAGGILLAFPFAIGLCTLLGFVLLTIDRMTTRCPSCGDRAMRIVNGIRETFPTGEGTGWFYACVSCGRRSFWSNDDRVWQDASGTGFDRWYMPGAD